MPNFKNNRGFNMKGKGNFDFGNKGIYDIKTETKDQSVVETDKPQKKSIFKKYGKSPMENGKKTKKVPKRPGLDNSKQNKTNLEQQYSKKIYTTATGDLFTDDKGYADITKKDADRLYRESGGNKKYDYRGKTNR
tara:strand:- start:405 stop:809 length:405 start_codon:yes stop_codon:yes gene_type:complete